MRDVRSAAPVIEGTYRAIKRLFPQINYAQGRTPPVTRATTMIREVVELNRTSRDALAFRRLAVRPCGQSIALRSWAVVAQFPLSAMASTSQSAFFVVYTTRGWKLYGGVLDRR